LDLLFGIPIPIFYIVILLAIIAILFVVFKRPIYEVMALSYILLIVFSGRFDLFLKYLIKPSTSTLFYAIVGFLLLAHVFGETRVIDRIISVILALVGRFRGGAGYVSLFGSTFMASLSGSGPGNVASTGVFTIPAMIRTGFPRHLAASVEMTASAMGPMIPPSGTILLAFGVLDALYPETFSLSEFWLVVWGIAIWFVLQRLITLISLTYVYDVKPIPKEELPSLRKSLKDGWYVLILPLMIFLPFLIDATMKDLIIGRIGADGAKAFSKTVLFFTPPVAMAYAILISRSEISKGGFWKNIFSMFKNSYNSVVPVSLTVYFAYSIAYVFKELELGEAVNAIVEPMNLSFVTLVLLIVFIGVVLGMVLPGSSQIAILGPTLVTLLVATGMSPIVAAGVLPALTGALEGMTPPLALCMYVAMGIAGSGFKETTKITLVWVGAHVIVLTILLLGLLPIPFS
jgi:TRAP-type C4-dicarboxylate transport system permease large subunit